MTTEITFRGIVAGNNGANGLIRMHWTKKRKLSNIYFYTVREATKNRHEGKVSVELVRYSCRPPMDYDNLVSTGKLLIDAIVKANVISEDNPEVIVERRYSQLKCKRIEQRTVITIKDYEGA